MRFIKCVAVMGAVSVMAGCANTYPYRGYCTYAATRKLLEDESAIVVTKAIGAPFLSIPETLYSPVTAYIDSSKHPPRSKRDNHVYLSYIGLRTIKNSDLPTPYKAFSGAFSTIIDTMWFPIAATVDVIYSINRDPSKHN